MAFSVRLFPYTGIVTTQQPQIVQMSSDSVFVLRDPYLDPPQKLQSNGANEVVSTAMPKNTKVLRVEVDDGNAIRYEVKGAANAGNQRVASTLSPSLSGKDLVYISEGMIFSFVDAAATP